MRRKKLTINTIIMIQHVAISWVQRRRLNSFVRCLVFVVQSRTWDAVAVVGRSCGHCLPYMSKRKRIQDLDDYADWVVAEAKQHAWVCRHAFLSRYSRSDTMFRKLQSRLSPDEWLHGCSTCEPPLHGHAIPLREYGSGGHQQEKPRKQLTIRGAFRATAVAGGKTRSCSS